MFDKFKKAVKSFSDGHDGKNIFDRAKEMMRKSNQLIQRTCENKGRIKVALVPLRAEIYDPVLIPFPHSAPSLDNTDDFSAKEAVRAEKTYQNGDENSAASAFFDEAIYSTKQNIDRLRSLSAKEVEQKLFLRHEQKKLHEIFPEIFCGSKYNEKLLVWFKCQFLHGTRPLKGSVYLTKDYLFLVSKSFEEVSLSSGEVYPNYDHGNPYDCGVIRVREAIAISEIVSLIGCVSVKNWYSSTIDAARTVSLLPLPDQGVEYNTIIIYLQDRLRVVLSDVSLSKGKRFCEKLSASTAETYSKDVPKISHSSSAQSLHAHLDKLWRSSCDVPYPNVKYNKDTQIIP